MIMEWKNDEWINNCYLTQDQGRFEECYKGRDIESDTTYLKNKFDNISPMIWGFLVKRGLDITWGYKYGMEQENRIYNILRGIFIMLFDAGEIHRLFKYKKGKSILERMIKEIRLFEYIMFKPEGVSEKDYEVYAEEDTKEIMEIYINYQKEYEEYLKNRDPYENTNEEEDFELEDD